MKVAYLEIGSGGKYFEVKRVKVTGERTTFCNEELHNSFRARTSRNLYP
jgi:hypothetical protein